MPPAASTFAVPPSLWRTVADASGCAWPPRAPEDVDRFTGTLDRQRLLALAERDAGLPAAVRDEAARRRERDAERSGRITREQDDALSAIAGGFPCDWIPVHGADLRTRLYPAPELRPMSDVDILIRPRDLPAAARWLVSRGYHPMPRDRSSIDHGFRLPGRESWIDLYQSFGQRQRADVDYDEIWRERRIGADRLPRLAPHHALAVHALRLAHEQFVSPLRRFVDLWLLSRDETIARQAFDVARRWRVARPMYAATVVLRRVVPETATDAWLAEAGALVDARGRRRLDRSVLMGAPFAALPSRPVQVWRKLLLLDTPGHRMRFVASHLAERARAVGRRDQSLAARA